MKYLQFATTCFQRWCQFSRTAITNFHRVGSLQAQVYLLTVLEARSLKSRYPHGQALSEGQRKTFPDPRCPLAYGSIDSNLCLEPHVLPCVSLHDFKSLSLLTTTQVTGFYYLHHNSVCSHLNLIISAKTLFINKVTFTGTRGQDFNLSFGETIQPMSGCLKFTFRCLSKKMYSQRERKENKFSEMLVIVESNNNNLLLDIFFTIG